MPQDIDVCYAVDDDARVLVYLVPLLYLLCFGAMGGLILFIAFRKEFPDHHESHHHQSEGRRERQLFFLLALSLLVWQLTLFIETHVTLPLLQLYLGRLNFTAIVFVVYFAYRFVHQVARTKPTPLIGLLGETILLAVLTLLTPLVDAEEWVAISTSGVRHPITRFGLLFPFYLLHVVGYWLAALIAAFQGTRQIGSTKARRSQLWLIGLGIFATGAVAVVTNAVLPYAYDDFRFCDAGTLATLLFIVSVAYAIFIHNLFDLRVILRETLVFGVLLAFILGAYSSSVFLATQYLTDSAGKFTQFLVLFLAFSFDPLRRFLEDKADQYLFGETVGDSRRKDRRQGKGKRRRRRFGIF